MLILGFGNKARQGKDIAAAAIHDYYSSLVVSGPRAHLRVGTFKFATALYQEVNEFLAIAKSFDYEYAELLKMGIRDVVGGDISITKIPDWVTLDPKPEVSKLAPCGKHPKLLQFWGTEYRRSQDPEYWTKKLFESIPTFLDIALITDVRFPNEFTAVKERGGYCVNITRLREDGALYFASDRPVGHLSEIALDNASWDFKLVNSAGHQALLGEQAITLCEYLRSLGPSK